MPAVAYSSPRRLQIASSNGVPAIDPVIVSNFTNLFHLYSDGAGGFADYSDNNANPITSITNANPAIFTTSNVSWKKFPAGIGGTGTSAYAYTYGIAGMTEARTEHYRPGNKVAIFLSATTCAMGAEWFGSITQGNPTTFSGYPHTTVTGQNIYVTITSWSGAFNATKIWPATVSSSSVLTIAYDSTAEPSPTGTRVIMGLWDSTSWGTYTASSGSLNYLTPPETSSPDGASGPFNPVTYYDAPENWRLWNSYLGVSTYTAAAAAMDWQLWIEWGMSDFGGNSTAIAKTNGIPDLWQTAVNTNNLATWDGTYSSRPATGWQSYRRVANGLINSPMWTTAQKQAIARAIVESRYFDATSLVGAPGANPLVTGNATYGDHAGCTTYFSAAGAISYNSYMLNCFHPPYTEGSREMARQLVGHVVFERMGGTRIVDTWNALPWERFTHLVDNQAQILQYWCNKNFSASDGFHDYAPFMAGVSMHALILAYEWETTRSGGNWPSVWSATSASAQYPTLQDLCKAFGIWAWTTPFEVVAPPYSDFAVSSSGTALTLGASASAVSNTYNNSMVSVLSGTGAGQNIICLTYNGGTKICTMTSAFSPVLDATSVVSITLAPSFWSPTGKMRLNGSTGKPYFAYRSKYWGQDASTDFSTTGGSQYPGLNSFMLFFYWWGANQLKSSDRATATLFANYGDQLADEESFDWLTQSGFSRGNEASWGYGKNFQQIAGMYIRTINYRLAASS